MKLATLTHAGETRIGVVPGGGVIDLAAAAPSLPRDRIGRLEAGEPALEAARRAARSATRQIPFAALRLRAPKSLRAGDRVRIEGERVGVLENAVIDEPADTARI